MRHTDEEAANSSCPQFPEFLQNAGRRSFLSGLATFLLVAGQGCQRAVQPPAEVTVVLIDQTWLDRSFQERRNLELEQFTKETGIRVKLLPAPEGAVETLDTWRSLLESGAKIPDVYAVGGGPIIEKNMVTVNNPETGRAFERAARWVGTISPPGVVTYKEWDAYNIWQAGQAAFMRNWATSHFGELIQGSITKDQFDIASLPRGRASIATTVGGRAYAVSRHSSILERQLCWFASCAAPILNSIESERLADRQQSLSCTTTPEFW